MEPEVVAVVTVAGELVLGPMDLSRSLPLPKVVRLWSVRVYGIVST